MTNVLTRATLRPALMLAALRNALFCLPFLFVVSAPELRALDSNSNQMSDVWEMVFSAQSCFRMSTPTAMAT